jgi:predicted transcriptional regulator
MSNPNELLEKILAAVAPKPDVVPEGWKDVDTWAQLWGMQRSQTFALLRQGMEIGIVARRRYRGKTGRMRSFYAKVDKSPGAKARS